ncbi:oxygenase MpaB family protein [Actinomycetospora lutea]|uniref:oxygenase MpaB family protein n=1 Tax=Actinomycetospora lutea TaxID=663604 RepID=UPI002366C62A|nr:oxygenase MpaB family protein [Actinomycetospora lutea]MDD7940008.1 oxygenase MpaB family protein [Actinomycetospora lutea]
MVAREQVEQPRYPGRFRAAPERSRRIARPLGLVARVRGVDEELLDRIGTRMVARDEVGADLAAAMSRPRGDAERVTMAAFHRALARGEPEGHRRADTALARFLAAVEDTPSWVDFAQVERGGRALRRMGRTLDDVLLTLSLIGGYRFGGPADLLVATGGLTGSTAMRRLGETTEWARAVISPGGMRRDGEGWRLTVHVRAMHALVNRRFETNGRWDVGHWGLPVNRSDQAATLGLFSSTGLLGARALGWVVTPAESRAVMHLWRYVGWLLGVDDDWLFTTEREQNHFLHHVLLVQDDVTPAGPALAGALVAGQRGEWQRRHVLGLLRWFLGREALRDLQLPDAFPWTVPPTVLRNLVLSGLVARTRAGRRLLERRGDAWTRAEIGRRFAGARPGVAALPDS